MANIRVNIDHILRDGLELVFRAPCDCSNTTGLNVHHPDANGNNKITTFIFKDAHGNKLTKANSFAKDTYVKVLLNTIDNIAHIYNADTNEYLEGRFNSMVSLKDGTAIPSNGDLNTYIEIGNFKCTSKSVVATLSNCPTDQAFKMVVGNNVLLDNGTYKYQEIVDLNGNEYWRRTWDDGISWSNWKHRLDDSMYTYVTPQMYGAKADGTTDDTQAIQSAIDSGIEVFFPKGNYKITSSISIPNNCKISGTLESVIVGTSEISGFVIGNLANNIRIKRLVITGCNYALDIDGFNCIFTDLLLKNSNVGCYIRTDAYANYFNECSFKYNDIGINGRIIYTSTFQNCQVYQNTTYGIKANFRCVVLHGGYIEENGIEKVSDSLIPQVGTAGIYIPDDATYGTGQLTFIGVDFENNGESAILQENQGRALDVTFVGGNFVVLNHDNTKAAIWLKVFDKVQRWLFYGTKFPENTALLGKQIAGHPDGSWSVSGKKPTQLYTNRRFDSSNANLIQYATIDGTITNSSFVTDAEKTKWNNKSDFSGAYNDLTGKPTIPTVPKNISAFTNDKGYITSIPDEYITETELTSKGYQTSTQVTDAINTAIIGAIEGVY